jgi:hypothetical protein
MKNELTPRQVLKDEFDDFVANWTWTPEPPKWEDVGSQYLDLGFVMNAMVQWARICVRREHDKHKSDNVTATLTMAKKALENAKYAIKGREHTAFIDNAIEDIDKILSHAPTAR